MPDFSRNNVWRVKRAAKHIEKSLDSLSRAGGELRPRELADLRKTFDGVLKQTETLLETMEEVVRRAAKEPPRFDLDEAAE